MVGGACKNEGGGGRTAYESEARRVKSSHTTKATFVTRKLPGRGGTAPRCHPVPALMGELRPRPAHSHTLSVSLSLSRNLRPACACYPSPSVAAAQTSRHPLSQIVPLSFLAFIFVCRNGEAAGKKETNVGGEEQRWWSEKKLEKKGRASVRPWPGP